MNDLITVIVPVYKVEKYLDRCIQSIVKQTYYNLEIILIDDGSPDRCPIMCDEWGKKDSRIKVIHKKNSGVSSTRNMGIDNANGKYIAFVDSDDWIEPTMYEVLYNNITKNNADMVRCNYCLEGSWGEIQKPLVEKGIVNINKVYNSYDKDQLMLFNKDYFQGYCWCALYRKCKISQKFDTQLILWEDVLFLNEYICKAEKIVVINDSLYHYFGTDTSATNKNGFNINVFNEIEVICRVYNMLINPTNEVKNNYNKELSVKLSVFILTMCRKKKIYDVRFNKMRNLLKKNFKFAMRNDLLTGHEKIIIAIANCCPKLYCKIKKGN